MNKVNNTWADDNVKEICKNLISKTNVKHILILFLLLVYQTHIEMMISSQDKRCRLWSWPEEYQRSCSSSD